MKRRPDPLSAYWFDAFRIGVDAQMVIGLRLLQAVTGRASAHETTLMVSEKLVAFADAQRAMIRGAPAMAAARVLDVYGQAVAGNRRRRSSPLL